MANEDFPSLSIFLSPACYLLLYPCGHGGKKKRKSSASGGSDRLPQPPHVTPGSGVWRSALPTCSPSHDPRRRKKPPGGRHRWDEAESRPSSLRFIDSFRPGAVTHNRSQGETDNSFMRNVSLRLFLQTNTLTPELKKARQGGINGNKKRWGISSIKKKEMEGWEARRSLRWPEWIWNRLGSGR